jgi:hypothetical protein
MDPLGHVTPAHIVTRERVSLAQATVRGGTVAGGCVRATGSHPATAEIRLRRPLRGQLVTIRLTPASELPASGLPLFLDNTLGYPGQPTAVALRTATSTTVDTGQTSAAGVRFDVAPGSRLCLRSLQFGQVLPGPA